MRLFIRLAALSAFLAAHVACKQQQGSELLSDVGEEVPKGACEANPSSPDDDRTAPSSAEAFRGCSEATLTGEIEGVEAGAQKVNEDLGKLDTVDKEVEGQPVMELQGDDEKIRQLERDIAAMQQRLAALRQERERRQSGQPVKTNVCVQVKGGKVAGCMINATPASCQGEESGVKKIFFAEGSCTYFRIDASYTGSTAGACVSVLVSDRKIGSCSYGGTREACEGGAGNAGYRYVFREQSCDTYRSGTVFTGTASVAGGSGNGQLGTPQGDGGLPMPTAFQERCVKEGGFPAGNMCQCDEAGWQLSESAFNSLKAGDCKVTVKGICNIVKGRIQSDGGCLCNGSTRYATSAFRIGTVCTPQTNPSPQPGPGPSPSVGPSGPRPPAPSPSAGACPSRAKGTLVVTVPRADSRLRVNGQVTSQSGTTRTFETPPLCIDRQYKYRIALDDAAPVEAVVQGRGTTRCTLPGRCETPR